MARSDLHRRLAAEAIGTAALTAAVIGSGIMADGLTDDNALTLLVNALATGAILVVLITVFAPISGAHFNPAVSLALALSGNLRWPALVPYVMAQIIGGAVGAGMAHLMFDLPIVAFSSTARSGGPLWLSETVAAFGLVFVILGSLRMNAPTVGWLVGLYIVAAYWFTSSTSFANPAVTIARSLTDTFAGIRPSDVPGFIVVQLVGACLAFGVGRWLFGKPGAEGAG
jgi:glycerol uptake facilitator-like aquaporin